MIQKTEKKEIRSRIHDRIRRKLRGTPERPRLAVFRSVSHIYVQVIDDMGGRTLVAASSVDKDAVGKPAKGSKAKTSKTRGGNVAAAKMIGKLVAERAKQKGITKVVFDRGGYQYHGRVKAVADGARKGGLEL